MVHSIFIENLKRSNHNRFENYGDDIDRRASETTKVVVGSRDFLTWNTPQNEYLKYPEQEVVASSNQYYRYAGFLDTDFNEREDRQYYQFYFNAIGTYLDDSSPINNSLDLYKDALGRLHPKWEKPGDHNGVLLSSLDYFDFYEVYSPRVQQFQGAFAKFKPEHHITAHYRKWFDKNRTYLINEDSRPAIEMAQAYRDIIMYLTASILRYDSFTRSYQPFPTTSYLLDRGFEIYYLREDSPAYAGLPLVIRKAKVKEKQEEILIKLFGEDKFNRIRRVLTRTHGPLGWNIRDMTSDQRLYANQYANVVSWSPVLGDSGYNLFLKIFLPK